MIILGLDTATFTASAALLDSERAEPAGQAQLLAEGTLDTSGRGDDLLVLIDELCKRAGIAPKQIGAVAVGAGPGSFTGLRIGMATAKGIAFAAGCPLWLVSSLAAMAAEEAAVAPPLTGSRLIAPILDARRGEVFAGFFLAGAAAPTLVEAAAEQVLAPEAVEAAIAAAVAAAGAASPTSSVTCCGDALEVHPAALAALAAGWSRRGRTPAGEWIARLALRGDRHDLLRSGRPAYLRPAEAEIMYPDGVPGALRTLALPSTLPPLPPEKS